jgi:hypothetical protein
MAADVSQADSDRDPDPGKLLRGHFEMKTADSFASPALARTPKLNRALLVTVFW